MAKLTFINFPVSNLVKSTEFYLALGFKIDSQFSDHNASALAFNKHLIFMLMTYDFFSKFTSKTIGDTRKNSTVIVSISMDSREEVQKFADTAKAHGGSYYMAQPNKAMGDKMFALEVEDLDDHILEPVFMDDSMIPSAS